MKFSKIATFAIAASLAAAPAVHAQDAAAEGATLTVGATVYGPQGGEVGTIETAEGGVVVVDTGSNKATLGADSFADGPDGPVIGMTKAQLDAAVDAAEAKAAAALNAALVAGAEVRTMDGTVLGTIDTIEADRIVIKRESGPLTLLRDQFSTDENGLIALFTMAQLNAALNAETGG